MNRHRLQERVGAVAVVCTALALVVWGLAARPAEGPEIARAPASPVGHIVELMMENHAFDNFFGTYPGADGIPANTSLPNGHGARINPYWIVGNTTGSPPHDQASERQDLDGGRMDGFIVSADAFNSSLGNVPVGYYNATQLAGYWTLAEEFVLCDHYFASVLGPTLPNRLYAIAGNSSGVTSNSLPAQGLDLLTIFDQLHAADVTWSYYFAPGGGHLPLPLYINPLRETPTETRDVLPMSGLIPTITAGRLPNVTFIDPSSGNLSEDPPSSVTTGEAWALSVIQAIEGGPQWGSTVIFLTWDEGGGFYDHVVPPRADSLGDGFRVPMIVISPFTEHGGVSSTVFDHTSVLRFIDQNWGLPSLNARVGAANNIGSTLDPALREVPASSVDGVPFASPSAALWTRAREIPSTRVLAGRRSRWNGLCRCARSRVRVDPWTRFAPNGRAVFSP